MRVHAALVTAFILAGGHSALADPLRADPGACGTDPNAGPPAASCATQAQAPKAVIILVPSPALLGDVLGARGPDPHAHELREIALAASIGDLEKVELAAHRLRKFGVTREAVREVIDQAQLHTASMRPANKRFFVPDRGLPEVEAGWENSQ
jgi:hypothetical protein